jgi:hypothetical protein
MAFLKRLLVHRDSFGFERRRSGLRLGCKLACPCVIDTRGEFHFVVEQCPAFGAETNADSDTLAISWLCMLATVFF